MFKAEDKIQFVSDLARETFLSSGGNRSIYKVCFTEGIAEVASVLGDRLYLVTRKEGASLVFDHEYKYFKLVQEEVKPHVHAEFTKVPAVRKPSKVMGGIGINDAWYQTQPLIEGKRVRCPAYAKWYDMLYRCYNVDVTKKNPTYIGCTVVSEWLTFSNFAEWFESNNVADWHLDKDLKVPNNKVYGPDTCLFLPQNVNNLMLTREAVRGDYPIGVVANSTGDKYSALISVDGKTVHCGVASTPEEAHQIYRVAKNKQIDRHIVLWKGHEFANYLSQHRYTVKPDNSVEIESLTNSMAQTLKVITEAEADVEAIKAKIKVLKEE